MEDSRIMLTRENAPVKIEDLSHVNAFFCQKGLVHHEFVSEGDASSQLLSRQCLIRSRQAL